jgi:ABC-type phosphate transport system ATPase subunit
MDERVEWALKKAALWTREGQAQQSSSGYQAVGSACASRAASRSAEVLL